MPPHNWPSPRPARAPEAPPPPAVTPDLIRGPAPLAHDDTRQGVTFTQHAVLDLLEQRQRLWADQTVDQQIEQARINAFDARNMHSAAYKHSRLIEAAARLLDAAERVAMEAHRG